MSQKCLRLFVNLYLHVFLDLYIYIYLYIIRVFLDFYNLFFISNRLYPFKIKRIWFSMVSQIPLSPCSLIFKADTTASLYTARHRP